MQDSIWNVVYSIGNFIKKVGISQRQLCRDTSGGLREREGSREGEQKCHLVLEPTTRRSGGGGPSA